MKKVFFLFAFLLFEYQFVSSKDLPSPGADKVQQLPTPAGSAAKATTVAGGNGQGSDANQLNTPQGLYVDEAGNVYISDTYNNRIQKWAPGAATGETIAGGNGNGSAANQLNHPSEIFVDRSGNLFIADQYNHRIQMWTKGASSGITVAGGHGQGAKANQLSLPFDVVVDKLGDIYISDTENDRIQRWSPGADSGVTVAGGTGRGSTAYKLDHPKGLVVEDSHNNYRSLHIADYNNGRVLYWPVGVDHGATEAGGKAPGSDLNQLQHPEGIMLDPSRRIVVVDQANNRIQRWTIMPARGTATTVAGGNGEGVTPGTLSSPSGIFVDAVGNIYVSDKNNHRVQKFGLPDNGPYLAMGIVVAGGIPLAPDILDPRALYFPRAVVVDKQGNLLVADYGNGRVQKWAPGAVSGITIASIGANGQNTPWSTSLWPKALALDSAENLYVLSDETVMKYPKGSVVGTAVAGRGRCCFVTDSSLTNPVDMFVDWKGVVYVVDNEGSRVVKWLPGARYGITVARATGKIDEYWDYKFRAITGDVSGNIYVADSKSSVKKFAQGDSVGVVVATSWGVELGDANLDDITGIQIDAAGNLYIATQYTNSILKWPVGAKSGIIVAGGVSDYYGNYNDGLNRIQDPQKIFVDSAENIYLAEGNINRVLKFVPRDPTSCPNNIYIKTFSCGDGVVVRWKAPAVVFPSNLYISLNKDPRGGTMKFIGSFNGHGYYKSERTYSWPAAAALAGAIGDTRVTGYLASIGSAAENDFLFNKIKDGSNAPWIGLFNTGFPGMFHWVDNTPISFTNWIPGEPNNAGGSVFNMKEPYVRMSNLNGKWNDQRDDAFQFVAEYNSPIDIYRQVSGPANGATLKPGIYTVCYEKTNAVSNSKDTCCFNIVVSCSSQASVHSAYNAESSIAANELAPNQLKAMISPNPTKTYFKLQISSSDNTSNINIKVSDLQGRKVEVQNNVKPNSGIEFGKNLRPGVYFVEVNQGAQTLVEKVIKQ